MVEKVDRSGSSYALPQVDKVLRHQALDQYRESMRKGLLTNLIREELDKRRSEIKEGATTNGVDSVESIALAVLETLEELKSSGVRRVINGTGVILNTNLGRAPLPQSILHHLERVGTGYTSLEIDVRSGKRGERTVLCQRLLSLLTGCQAGLVVNNNASAVLLGVSALARGKEVIVSRGELIEIGGSFRLPDVITSAGAILREVGTTNRTRISDYREAINENTGLILRCHRSNFAITGFTEEASLQDLVKLSRDSKIPLVEDLGSGALVDLSRFGLKYEPTVDESVALGVGLVMFSGDKLLGGTQAGIIVGEKSLVGKLRKNAMYRALRADKLIIALIESVLQLYLAANPEKFVPALALASLKPAEIEDRVRAFMERCVAKVADKLKVSMRPTESTLGGGSLPGQTQDSFALALTLPSMPSDQLATRLRAADPPVISIVQNNEVLIDFRTILLEDESVLLKILETIAEEAN